MSQSPHNEIAGTSVEVQPQKSPLRAILALTGNWVTGLIILVGVGLLFSRGASSGVWWIVVPTWLGIGIAGLVSLVAVVSNLPELGASQARWVIVGTCFFLLGLPHYPGWLWALEFWAASAVMYWLDQSGIRLVKGKA